MQYTVLLYSKYTVYSYSTAFSQSYVLNSNPEGFDMQNQMDSVVFGIHICIIEM